MKASVIISVYKNTYHLGFVLDSLKQQTEKDFEIIISEDGNDQSMCEYLQNYSFEHTVQHLTQDDLGWRKNRALNRAVMAAKSKWLIFIDGDCVLHPSFVEMHLKYAEPNRILAGKRVKLTESITPFFLDQGVHELMLKSPLFMLKLLKKYRCAFAEEGPYISPNSFWSFIPKLRKMKVLKGCNMSFSKEAILAINGFDEDYIRPALGEDVDLTWRFKGLGYSHFSLRNRAVQFHLYHKENWTDQDENYKIYYKNKSNRVFICKNGITKNE